MTKIYENVKTGYLCLLAAYVALRELPAMNFLIGRTAVSAAVFLGGFILIIWGLILRADAFRDRRGDLLILFTAITAVSCLVNRGYGLTDNVKTLGAMVLFFFLLFPAAGGTEPRQAERQLRAVGTVLCVLWTCFSLLSAAMYILDVELKVVKVTGELCPQGFYSLMQRLYGLFQDPNYAGAVCLAVIVLCFRRLFRPGQIALRIAAALAAVLNFSYLVLGASRSAQLIACAVTAVTVFYRVASVKKLRERVFASLPRIAAGLVSAGAAAALVFAAIFAFSYALPLVKNTVQATATAQIYTRADAFYDALYLHSGLEVARTSEQIRPTATPDSDHGEKTPVSETKPIRRTDLADDEDVSNGRLARWQHALQIFAKTPLFGASPRNIIPFAKENNPDTLMATIGTPSHNGYLDVLVGTGVPGAAVMLLFLVLCAVPALKKYFRLEGDGVFAADLAVFLTFALSGLFVSDLFFMFTPGAVLFWYALGRVCADTGSAEKRGLLYAPVMKLGGKLRKEPRA